MRSKLNKNKIIIIVVISIIIISAVIGIVLYFTLKKSNSNSNNNNNNNIIVNPLTGYWMTTYGGDGSTNPPNICDIGIIFSGNTAQVSIEKNRDMLSNLTSREKFLNLGGGGTSGIWTPTDFDYINSKLSDIKLKGWTGVSFDIEVCTQSVSFVNAFADCFARCKAAGLKVLVTTSGILPYACNSGSGQGKDLVDAWIKDRNIDYLSPQLYGADGTTLTPIDLSTFSTAIAKIVPSIPYDTDWSKIQNLGIVPAGYLAWLRRPNYCGLNFDDTKANCKTAAKCVDQDSQCPTGQKCFKGINCSMGGPNFCGINWTDAKTNCKTADRCTSQNSECPSGQSCFNNITC
jgi:hypothetical protein